MQKTAYEMRISDWSSDVCSSDLGDPETEDCGPDAIPLTNKVPVGGLSGSGDEALYSFEAEAGSVLSIMTYGGTGNVSMYVSLGEEPTPESNDSWSTRRGNSETVRFFAPEAGTYFIKLTRSEEHTSELQSLMRSSYAVFCLKKKKKEKQ